MEARSDGKTASSPTPPTKPRTVTVRRHEPKRKPPELWSPGWCVFVGLTAGVGFAAYMCQKNWLELRKNDQARKMQRWVMVGAALFVLAFVPGFGWGAYGAMSALFWVWYFTAFREYRDHLEYKLDSEFESKGIFWPTIWALTSTILCIFAVEVVRLPKARLAARELSAKLTANEQQKALANGWFPFGSSAPLLLQHCDETVPDLLVGASDATQKHQICQCITVRVMTSMTRADFIKSCIGGNWEVLGKFATQCGGRFGPQLDL